MKVPAGLVSSEPLSPRLVDGGPLPVASCPVCLPHLCFTGHSHVVLGPTPTTSFYLITALKTLSTNKVTF